MKKDTPKIFTIDFIFLTEAQTPSIIKTSLTFFTKISVSL